MHKPNPAHYATPELFTRALARWEDHNLAVEEARMDGESLCACEVATVTEHLEALNRRAVLERFISQTPFEEVRHATQW